MSKKEVMIVTGAGQISMAIARRVGYGKKIVMGDKNIENAKSRNGSFRQRIYQKTDQQGTGIW